MNNEVKAWEELVNIPTYRTGEPDKNPMFLEKRIYQGSSGVVYPHPVIDKVFDDKEDKEYNALFIENKYLKIMILPELGGRIQMAYDKTNDYHFVYYNQVIKPALVGLAGPWISGGIEFNWPQHHRPSTFDPLDYGIEDHADGSKTVWVSEIEKMFHTKGMAGFRLYPETAYLEITGKLYNRTALPQSFLWWANPAVAVDEYYQSVFPPDVNAVYDHGKRDVSSFPIATGTYYKVDYSPGTDISWYKNIPVPTSYMAVNSAFDFMGGYHHQKKAGLLHVSDHHSSPGKKQWTWGNGEFGQAWDRQLTDEDGPYFELMTGMFTDNQPDFGWIMPNEERTFTQYFLPYKEIGYVKNASKDVLLNLAVKGEEVTINVYFTAEKNNIWVRLSLGRHVVFLENGDLSPTKIFTKTLTLPENRGAKKIKLDIIDEAGNLLLTYSPVEEKNKNIIPESAKPLRLPNEISSNEELYLAGLHLEQYRHSTFSPVPYYEEALRRDPSDVRNNNGLGLWYLRRGQFTIAETYFRTAIKTLLKHNPNPYDGEPLYNLGLSLFYQDKPDQAYDSFFKACWNAAWQDNSYLQLARIAAQKEMFNEALQLIEKSLSRNYHGFKARHLKMILLRKLKQVDETETFATETLKLDNFDFGSLYELHLALNLKGEKKQAESRRVELQEKLRNNSHTYLEIAIDYAWAGFYQDAINFLLLNTDKKQHPLNAYYLSYYFSKIKDHKKALEWAYKGFEYNPDRIFPNRLEDITVLQHQAAVNPHDFKTWYYLGNLWYDKRQYANAIQAWEKSRDINDRFATVNRNLGIAYFNKLNRKEDALKAFEKAFATDPSDSRVLFELDNLYKRFNRKPDQRLRFLSQHLTLVLQRDDLYTEFVTLHNLTGGHREALDLLAKRQFHPWEGGEGKVTQQYVQAKIALGRKALQRQDYLTAIELLKEAETYPGNLGEGKLHGSQENDIHYWLGCAFEIAGDLNNAELYWNKAIIGLSEPSAALFYNDQQPDKIFYQGLAWVKLSNKEESDQQFKKLIAYGLAHMNDQMEIDYFAVSLPELTIFDNDLDKENKIHCNYLLALGYLGLNIQNKATEYFKQVMEMNANHQGAVIHVEILSAQQLSVMTET